MKVRTFLALAVSLALVPLPFCPTALAQTLSNPDPVEVQVTASSASQTQLTVTYTNQAGQPNRTGQATVPAGSPVGNRVDLLLEGNDTAVSSIGGVTQSGGAHGASFTLITKPSEARQLGTVTTSLGAVNYQSQRQPVNPEPIVVKTETPTVQQYQVRVVGTGAVGLPIDAYLTLPQGLPSGSELPVGTEVFSTVTGITLQDGTPADGESFKVCTKPGSPQALKSITVSASRIQMDSGNDQEAMLGTTLSLPLSVRITDADGNPVSGRSVSFSFYSTPSSATGQTLTPTQSTPGANGLAQTQVKIGNKTGTYVIRATSSGLSGSPVTFTATGTAATASSIARVSGNNQTGLISTKLAQPFVVKVKDAQGQPVKGHTVKFSITSTPSGATGQKLSASSATTSSTGEASTYLTLGNKAGTYSVEASASGLSGSPVKFSASAGTTTVSSFKITAPTSGTAGKSLSITVTAYGKDGKVMTNYNGKVKLTSTDPRADLPTDNGADWQNGTKTFSITLYTSGTQKITATSGNVSQTSAGIKIRSAAAHSLHIASGNNQTTIPEQELPEPIVAHVSDAYGNPISGVTVNFAFSSIPSRARDYFLSSKSRLTDAQGLAGVKVTLGDETGTYKIRATSTGLVGSPMEFTATAVEGTLGGFRVETLPRATIGVPSAFTVTALTKSGHVKVDYTGRSLFTSTDKSAVLGPDDGLGWENGVKVFGVVFHTAGTHRITVTHGSVSKVSPSITVTTRQAAKDIRLTIGSIHLLADGTQHTMDVAPYIRDNRTFMPVRFASEALGANVEWDPVKRQVLISRGNTMIVLTIGSRIMKLNNTSVTLDVAPEIVDPGRTMMPIRAVAEGLGGAVTWNDNTRTVRILMP